MRLTLRTLLAWLDDTLPPGEVRQIGMQVNESQFAKELGDRIQRVTRQRRLSVPTSSGVDGTDPALVAAYLDNELTPEAVTDFEKRCLTSDVHLAEVASVHQILSLIGQKAKVPSEARHRMYHLVKGREAVSSLTPRTFSPTPEQEPAAAPLPPWTPPELPSRSPWERFGLPAAVAVLLLLLMGSAWWMTGPANEPSDRGQVAIAAIQPLAKPPAINEVAKEELKPELDPVVADPLASKKAEPAEPEAPADAVAKAPVPPGSVATLVKSEGVLLRLDASTDKKGWERVTPEAGLKAEDRLASLDPFRSALKFGETTVELIGSTEIHVQAPQAGEAARIELGQGKIILRASTPASPITIRSSGQGLKITPPSGETIGIERTAHRGAGDIHAMPSLRLFLPAGETILTTSSSTESLTGPGTVILQASGKFTPKVAEPAPGWVTEEAPSPVEQELGRLFGKYFSKGHPAMVDLVEALDDKQPEIRRLALSGLETIGEIDMIVPALTTPENAPTRRGAIAVLRSYAARGPDFVKELRTHLQQSGGPDWAATVEKLLAGYTPKEATEEATYVHLVKLLKSPDVGIRELALDNLMMLTDRNSLEYDPDHFEGSGLAAWQELLKRKELPGKIPAKPE